MFYSEYAIAARTHYKSCKFLYDNCIVGGKIKDGGTSDILYRLYYLCGHIIECASIFLIYDFFKWHENNDIAKWNGKNRHIHMGYNKKFTMASHMDFYPLYVDPNTKKFYVNHQSIVHLIWAQQSLKKCFTTSILITSRTILKALFGLNYPKMYHT